ncbi:hypothetical protein EV356DRAFT_529171 [Viridothelium virens]|uniref:Uncharacterized protein n=1 Tax=Viridothelium virens TaxID=1048519 RepID=A0A6A6HMI1_VIRVR|nr:hypothetical protein EV356DRAFT_529171 [Viridothelium virens]
MLQLDASITIPSDEEASSASQRQIGEQTTFEEPHNRYYRFAAYHEEYCEISSNSITSFFPAAKPGADDAHVLSEAENDTASVSDKTPKIVRVNPGGSSQINWFNELLQHPELDSIRRHLINKIARIKTTSSGCQHVIGFTAGTRPIADKNYLEKLRTICTEAPSRYEIYHIALLKAKKARPAFNPPPYPRTPKSSAEALKVLKSRE